MSGPALQDKGRYRSLISPPPSPRRLSLFGFPLVLLNTVGFALGLFCKLAVSVFLLILDAGFSGWNLSTNAEMAHVHRPSVPEDTDTLSIQGLSSRSSLLSLPAFDLEPDVHIVEGNASTPCSPAVSPQRGKERFDSLPPLPPNLTTSPRRSRSSSGTDNSVLRRRTLTVQHDQDPIPHLHLILAVATPYPQYVDSPLSSASSLLAPQPPSVPSFRTRPRALSDSHTSTSPPPRFSSLQARSQPATYLAYVLDLADSTSLFDSSDASDDDSVGASLGHDDLSDVEEDEDEDARDQDWVETSSLPSNSSSFHLAALFEEDSDEDEPSHVEHYFPPPTRSRTITDPHGDDNLHRSDSTRGGTRTRVFPVVGDDDSSSDDDDSSEDEYERDSWRPMEVSGGGRINSLGLETNWSSPAEVLSPGFDAWRRQRDEARQREDQSFGRQFTPPPSPYTSLPSSPHPTPTPITLRPRQMYRKVLVDLGLRLTPHLSSPFSEILAEKWKMVCEEEGEVKRGSPLRWEILPDDDDDEGVGRR